MLTCIVVVGLLITISLHIKFDMSSFIRSKEREHLEVSHVTHTGLTWEQLLLLLNEEIKVA